MAAGSDQEILGPLLNVLAQSLDVRAVFAQISALARQTVPHDLLHFGVVTDDHRHLRLLALSAEQPGTGPEVPMSEEAQRTVEEDFAIIHHVRPRRGDVWALEGRVRSAGALVDRSWEWQPHPAWGPW